MGRTLAPGTTRRAVLLVAITALKTFAELGHRLTRVLIQANVTVTLVSNAPSSDPFVLNGVEQPALATAQRSAGRAGSIVSGGRTLTNPRATPPQRRTTTSSSPTARPLSSPWIQKEPLPPHKRHAVEDVGGGAISDLGAGKLSAHQPAVDLPGSRWRPLTSGDTYEVLQLPTFADVFVTGGFSALSVKLSLLNIIGATGIGGEEFSTAAGVGDLFLDRVTLHSSSFTASSGQPRVREILFENVLPPGILLLVVRRSGAVHGLGVLSPETGRRPAIEYTEVRPLVAARRTSSPWAVRQFQAMHDARLEKFAPCMAYDFERDVGGSVGHGHLANGWVSSVGGEQERRRPTQIVTDGGGKVS